MSAVDGPGARPGPRRVRAGPPDLRDPAVRDHRLRAVRLHRQRPQQRGARGRAVRLGGDPAIARVRRPEPRGVRQGRRRERDPGACPAQQITTTVTCERVAPNDATPNVIAIVLLPDQRPPQVRTQATFTLVTPLIAQWLGGRLIDRRSAQVDGQPMSISREHSTETRNRSSRTTVPARSGPGHRRRRPHRPARDRRLRPRGRDADPQSTRRPERGGPRLPRGGPHRRAELHPVAQDAGGRLRAVDGTLDRNDCLPSGASPCTWTAHFVGAGLVDLGRRR